MRPEEIAIFVVVAALFAVLVWLVTAKGDTKELTLTTAEGGTVRLQVEVANSSATRMKGLMGRKSLDEYSGMLFAFGGPGRYGFWMMNTSIPLDAVYLSQNGTVVDIVQMDPCGLIGCPVYYPKADASYVLEVNQGFSERHGIEIGKSVMSLGS